MTINIYNSEVLEFCKQQESNKYHSCFCDPPYALTCQRPLRDNGGVEKYHRNGFMNAKWDGKIPDVELWSEILRTLRPGAFLLAWAGARTQHKLITNIELSGFNILTSFIHLYGSGFPKAHKLEIPGWDGEYKTPHLKPMHEVIVLAQKPCDGTYTENCIKWGCGALDIGGTRIGNRQRFPGDVLLQHTEECSEESCSDGCPVKELDEQNGVKTSGARRAIHRKGDEQGMMQNYGIYGKYKSVPYIEAEKESGCVSRYFSQFYYHSKPNRKERDMGCGEGNPHNPHPCIKSIDVNAWLATLILPPVPDATMLQPFGGSGSETLGAMKAGWNNIDYVEMESNYVEIAKARIEYWQNEFNK